MINGQGVLLLIHKFSCLMLLQNGSGYYRFGQYFPQAGHLIEQSL